MRWFILLLLTSGGLGASEISFEKSVRPLLKAHCFHCHGEGGRKEGGVDLRLRRFLLKETDERHPVKYKGETADLYAWYYNTQACLMYGGSAWTKWNRLFQDEVASAQTADGSWPAPGGKAHGPQTGENMTGKVYRSALCILMLEVFYRYMPTTK